MRCRKTRLGWFIRRQSASALLCAASLGAAGCAGGHLDLSSRWSGIAARTDDERPAVAEVSKHDTERDSADHIQQTGLERILPFRRDAEPDAASQDPSGGGRVFSAFVNRLPGRRKATSDPFLDNRSVAEQSASDPRTPTAGVARTKPPTRQVVARTTSQAPQRERSDAELWQMFNADVAGTANVRATAKEPAPTRGPTPVAAVPSRAPASTDSLPAWAQEQPAQPQSSSSTRDLASLVAQPKPQRAQPPRSPLEHTAHTRINPSSKPQTVPAAPAMTRREADLRLQQLLAEARSHQEKGALFEAYRIAVIAEEFAEREQIVFAPRQPRPVDIVREIEQQMQASFSAAPEAPDMAAPTVAPQLPPSGPVAVATPQSADPISAGRRRTSDPFADNSWSTQRPRVETEVARQPAPAPDGRFDASFPALHEWRGVRANSPVSLAVGNTSTEANVELPDQPVQQALATGDAAAASRRAPLLARAEADRDRMLEAGQGTSLFSGDLRTPPLATAAHPDLKPVAVPAPPPLNVTPNQPPFAAATPGAARSSGGGLVWWVLGGLVALAGVAAARYRRQPAGRR